VGKYNRRSLRTTVGKDEVWEDIGGGCVRDVAEHLIIDSIASTVYKYT
jgi:hypothetical protein